MTVWKPNHKLPIVPGLTFFSNSTEYYVAERPKREGPGVIFNAKPSFVWRK